MNELVKKLLSIINNAIQDHQKVYGVYGSNDLFMYVHVSQLVKRIS